MSSNPVWVTAAVGLALFAGAVPRGGRDSEARVDVVRHEAERRVDILIDGKPFTAYRYGDASVKKPILYPLRSARGTVVTRGFPLDPRAGERADHPHQVGHWFNHGDVNGFDFWGHSDATPPDLRAKAGSVVHTGVLRSDGGGAVGRLVVTADWIVPDGKKLLEETSVFTFRGGADWRAVDRETTWTAVGGPVVFGDTKEGSFGIRVARALEHPSDQRDLFVDPAGRVETTPRVDATPVTGQYLGSDGKTGDAVWGTRGPWMALAGTLEGETVTIAIFDHPKNPGHPTSWHARGYGLFAANPFGQQGFDPKRPRTPTTLPAGAAFTFRHRILVRTGRLTHDGLQQEHQRFLAAQS